MGMKKSGDNGVEEYKTLRAEILRNLEAAERNMLACITASIVALVYGAREDSLPALAFAFFAPIYFWLQHVIYKRKIAKLSAYISVFHEGFETGLMWETRVHKTDLAKGSRLELLYIANAILLPYPILLIVSAIAFAMHVDRTPWVLGIAVFAVAVLLIAWQALTKYAVLRKDWLNHYRSIQAEEQESILNERPSSANSLSSRPTRGLKRTPSGAA